MQIKLKRKAKASGGLLKENKGLTLVELVIAVAILGIMVSPVLHAFTTSQTIDNKARKMSEATDAAHNIMEVIDSVSVANFLETDDSKSLIGYDSLTKGVEEIDENKKFDCAIIKGIESGKSTFDAKVIFGSKSIDDVAEENDIFNTINQMEIVDYGDPEGTFAQPYISSANPDDIAETYFKTQTNNKTYTQKTRTIVIDVTTEGSKEDDTLKIFINVKYQYEFIYLVQETDEFGIGTGTYKPATFSKDIVYSAIPAGAPPRKDGSPICCYVMYYPEYGTASRPARDIITINNLEDVPVRLLVVKQWPMVCDPKTGQYSEMDSITLDANEKNYRCEITENHSSSFDLEEDGEKLVYTNARTNLSTYGTSNEEISQVTYKVISGIKARYRTDLIKDGGIITTTKKNRFYDVAIYLYEEGQIGDEGEPFAKFRATKAE